MIEVNVIGCVACPFRYSDKDGNGNPAEVCGFPSFMLEQHELRIVPWKAVTRSVFEPSKYGDNPSSCPLINEILFKLG